MGKDSLKRSFLNDASMLVAGPLVVLLVLALSMVIRAVMDYCIAQF